jgi:predicted N-acetyltransferase YhbS
MFIRNGTPDDIDAITEVTIAAFKTLPISQHTEQFIIEALRAAKSLTVLRADSLNDGLAVTLNDGTVMK